MASNWKGHLLSTSNLHMCMCPPHTHMSKCIDHMYTPKHTRKKISGRVISMLESFILNNSSGESSVFLDPQLRAPGWLLWVPVTYPKDEKVCPVYYFFYFPQPSKPWEWLVIPNSHPAAVSSFLFIPGLQTFTNQVLLIEPTRKRVISVCS